MGDRVSLADGMNAEPWKNWSILVEKKAENWTHGPPGHFVLIKLTPPWISTR